MSACVFRIDIESINRFSSFCSKILFSTFFSKWYFHYFCPIDFVEVFAMSASKLDQSSTLEIYSASTETRLSLPLIGEGISAGFPSPALDFIDLSIDMNRHLVKHPATTFYGRVKGHSMKIAVCYIDGEFTIKRIRLEEKVIWLLPENEAYQPIRVTEENDFLIWGMVTHVIKAL